MILQSLTVSWEAQSWNEVGLPMGYKHGRWTHCSSTLSLDVLPVAPTHHHPPLVLPTSSWHTPLCFLGQQLEPTSMFFPLLNSFPRHQHGLYPHFLYASLLKCYSYQRGLPWLPSAVARSTTLSPFSLPLFFSLALPTLTYCWYIFVGLYASLHLSTGFRRTGGLCLFYSLLHPQSLKQCLATEGPKISCWMNNLINSSDHGQ